MFLLFIIAVLGFRKNATLSGDWMGRGGLRISCNHRRAVGFWEVNLGLVALYLNCRGRVSGKFSSQIVTLVLPCLDDEEVLEFWGYLLR